MKKQQQKYRGVIAKRMKAINQGRYIQPRKSILLTWIFHDAMSNLIGMSRSPELQLFSVIRMTPTSEKYVVIS